MKKRVGLGDGNDAPGSAASLHVWAAPFAALAPPERTVTISARSKPPAEQVRPERERSTERQEGPTKLLEECTEAPGHRVY